MTDSVRRVTRPVKRVASLLGRLDLGPAGWSDNDCVHRSRWPGWLSDGEEGWERLEKAEWPRRVEAT